MRGKPRRRFPRHSGREAGIQGRDSYRESHVAVSLRHSGREAGIPGRDSNLAVTIGAKVARPLTLPGLGPGFPAGTTEERHMTVERRHSDSDDGRRRYHRTLNRLNSAYGQHPHPIPIRLPIRIRISPE